MSTNPFAALEASDDESPVKTMNTAPVKTKNIAPVKTKSTTPVKTKGTVAVDAKPKKTVKGQNSDRKKDISVKKDAGGATPTLIADKLAYTAEQYAIMQTDNRRDSLWGAKPPTRNILGYRLCLDAQYRARIASKNAGGKAPTLVADKPAKYARTAEQNAIIDAQHKARIAARANKDAKAEIATRCHYFADCGGRRENEYPYCRRCYTDRTGFCTECAGVTRLAAKDVGTHHKQCPECRIYT